MSETPTSDWTWINAAADRFEVPGSKDHGRGSRITSPRSIAEAGRATGRTPPRRARAAPSGGRGAGRRGIRGSLFRACRADRSRFRCRSRPIHPIATAARAADVRAGLDSRPNRRQRRADCRQPRPLLWRLRDHPRDRPRRHGRRLPGPPDQPQPAGGAEDDPRRPARRRDRRQAVPDRGRGGRQPRPSGDRADLRSGPARGPALLLDGLRRGAEPRPAAGRRPAAGPRGGRAAASRSPRRSTMPTGAA